MQSLKRNLLLTCATAVIFQNALLAKGADDHGLLQEKKKEEQMPTPWLTGPLLTPSAHVIPTGHYNFEPYLFGTTNFGIYNSNWKTSNAPNFYNVLSSSVMQFGLPAWFDFQFIPQFSWNHTHGASHWVLNDMPWGFDYQLLNDSPDHWWPAILISQRANFPIGKYQKLSAHSLGTDIGGSGSWEPAVALGMSKLFWFGGYQFLAIRWNAKYTFQTPVHVKGYNAYGGGHRTHGKVYPGQNFSFLFGLEYAFTRRWVFAFDFDYSHTNKSRFKGHAGKTKGVPNTVTLPSSEQFSIAPAFEYNWSAYVGIIAGCWFTVGGRNTPEFASGVVAVNIYK